MCCVTCPIRRVEERPQDSFRRRAPDRSSANHEHVQAARRGSAETTGSGSREDCRSASSAFRASTRRCNSRSMASLRRERSRGFSWLRRLRIFSMGVSLAAKVGMGRRKTWFQVELSTLSWRVRRPVAVWWSRNVAEDRTVQPAAAARQDRRAPAAPLVCDGDARRGLRSMTTSTRPAPRPAGTSDLSARPAHAPTASRLRPCLPRHS